MVWPMSDWDSAMAGHLRPRPGGVKGRTARKKLTVNNYSRT
jgi:hypothetical protein